MVPMARTLVVGVVFIAAPCAFAELKPTRQPITAKAAAETNFMLSSLCVSLRRPGESSGRARSEGRGERHSRFPRGRRGGPCVRPRHFQCGGTARTEGAESTKRRDH